MPEDAALAGAPMSVLLVADSRWGGAPRDAAHALEPRSLLHGEALGAALLSDWATERLGELLATLELYLPYIFPISRLYLAYISPISPLYLCQASCSPPSSYGCPACRRAQP